MRDLRLLLPALLLTTTACATKLGPRSLPQVRTSYNEAVSASTDEQMLLNVVRLRYLHSTTFLQVGSVTTQYSLATNVGINGNGNIDAPDNGVLPGGSVGGSAGLTLTERPTITYTPLQGEAFVHRLATPLSAELVMLLIESGWGADLVVNTCIRQINGIHAPSTAMPGTAEGFHRLSALLHVLQQRHELTVERAAEGPGVTMSVRAHGQAAPSAEAKELLRLLNLSPFAGSYQVAGVTHDRPPETVSIRGRSMLDAMFYLARGVDVPEGDAAAYETVSDGYPPPLRVRQSRREPKGAYVKVHYRDRWFYVDDADHESKRAFAFLTFVFNLTSVAGGGGPMLTIGAGG